MFRGFLFPAGISPCPALSAVSTLLSALSVNHSSTTFPHSTNQNSGSQIARRAVLSPVHISPVYQPTCHTCWQVTCKICVPKSSRNRRLSFGDEFPSHNHSQCRLLHHKPMCQLHTISIRQPIGEQSEDSSL